MKRHLLLLTIDAWRADFQDRFLDHPLVPALESLRPRLARFDRFWANGPWTTPAIVSLMTGRHPIAHRTHYAWSRPPAGPSLAGVLAAHGWRCPNLCYLTAVDNYAHLGYRAAAAPPPPERGEDRLHRAIAAAAGGAPSLLWYHYKYVHLPYWASAPHRARFGVEQVPERLRASIGTRFIAPREEVSLDSADRPLVQRMYAAVVREMSDWLAGVFAAIEATGEADRFTIVITADHGDEHLEHGHVGHASTAHHGRVYEELLRIPCLVIDPRIAGPQRIAHRAEGRDLFPTLLGLMGVPCPATDAVDFSPTLLTGRAPGADPQRLFAACSSRWGYRTPRALEGHGVWSISDGSTKYVRERYDAAWDALFDLDADPGEQAPITDGPALTAWRRRLDRLFSRLGVDGSL